MKSTLRAQAAPWHAGVQIWAETADGRLAVKEVVTEPIEAGMERRPTFFLTDQDAQTLMDDLWYSGLRPTEGTGSAGALRATERHLEDMRTLVFREAKQ